MCGSIRQLPSAAATRVDASSTSAASVYSCSDSALCRKQTKGAVENGAEKGDELIGVCGLVCGCPYRLMKPAATASETASGERNPVLRGSLVASAGPGRAEVVSHYAVDFLARPSMSTDMTCCLGAMALPAKC